MYYFSSLISPYTQPQNPSLTSAPNSPPQKRKTRSAKGRVQSDTTPRRPFTSKPPSKSRPGTTRTPQRPSTTKGGNDTRRSGGESRRNSARGAASGGGQISGRKENLPPKKPLLQQVCNVIKSINGETFYY